jgi:hypothetical protein
MIDGFEYNISIDKKEKSLIINGIRHDFDLPLSGTNVEDAVKEIIRRDRRHWDFHHMSGYDEDKTKEIQPKPMRGFPHFTAEPAYGYGFVYKYEGDTSGCSKVMSGMTQKLARQIADEMNRAVDLGYNWARHVIIHCKRELDFEKCLNKFKLMEKTKEEWK